MKTGRIRIDATEADVVLVCQVCRWRTLVAPGREAAAIRAHAALHPDADGHAMLGQAAARSKKVRSRPCH